MSKEKMRIISYSSLQNISIPGRGKKRAPIFGISPTPVVNEIPSEVLERNMKRFLNMLGKMLSSAPDDIGGFKIDELDVHADVDAKGKLGILGSGLGIGASGGILIKLTRK